MTGVRRRRARGSERSIAGRILGLLVLLMLLLVGVGSVLAVIDARQDARDVARSQALATAWAVADAPSVRSALRGPEPSEVLQPFAERVRRDTGVDFVVVMKLDRTRFTHPDPSMIGESFVGDLGDARSGRAFTQQFTGTLGPSVRAVVPVREAPEDRSPDGTDEVIALVSAGVTVAEIDAGLTDDLLVVVGAAVLVLLLGYAGAWAVVRRLRRDTHGLGPGEMARIFEYHQAVLHAVREGLLLLDARGVVQLANDEAYRLLTLPADVRGRAVDDLGLPASLVRAIGAGAEEHDAVHVVGDHVLVVSSTPAVSEGREVGSVVTLRDRTELQETMGELDTVRGLTDSLRSQQHEAANRLHTVVSLIETGRAAEAVAFATDELQLVRRVTDDVLAGVGDPALGALLLAKLSQAEERGIRLQVVGSLPEHTGIPSRDLVTVLGNLLDNAFDAVDLQADADADEREVRCLLAEEEGRIAIVVEDSGPGTGDLRLADLAERGWSTKATDGGAGAGGSGGSGGSRGIGLALVAQVVRRHGGDLALFTSELGGAGFRVMLPTREVARS